MAHFAEIDADGVVQRVLVVPDSQEHRGEAFLRDDLGLGGRWVQTSYSGANGRRFAGAGMRWHAELKAFVEPQPFNSWTLDTLGDWQPPLPHPGGDGWTWDDAAQRWIESPAPKAE